MVNVCLLYSADIRTQTVVVARSDWLNCRWQLAVEVLQTITARAAKAREEGGVLVVTQ